MPAYLDFNTTKTIRDSMIARTLNRPNGPQTFTSSSYSYQNLSNYPDIDLGDVDDNRNIDLLIPQTLNTYKPIKYFIQENLSLLPRRANLGLYPYFVKGNYNLISIMTNANYDTESELFKFAAYNIRENREGPVHARIQQNLESATIGRFKLIDALEGHTSTAINLITGKESLIEKNYKITVAKTLPGKGIDFMKTVAGLELPFSQIPGDYLTNPQNPIDNRPIATTEAGAIGQDVTGFLGSLVGIQRRPTLTRKPSDLFIEYMGDGQRTILFDLLSYSKYAPNYTTTARSQQSSKLFKSADKLAQNLKTLIGREAPEGKAYIGDDRSNDVTYATSDFYDNIIKSSYYLSLMFDPVQSDLFERRKSVIDGGQLSGKLTWISRNSKNKLYETEKTIPVTSFDGGTSTNTYNREQNQQEVSDSLSKNYIFRDGSILNKTQQILDSMPKEGMASRTHVGNVIDQTSRIFKEGDGLLSRGSAIKYVNKFNEESGMEYCRVWTKDRAYTNYSDTMKRTGNIRKFEDSVIGGMSRPWNINIAPMSDGSRNFRGVSTNIQEEGGGFYAKKYMFSIENLAWKTSNTPGFTYNDLPYCERGNNGGRVMWFPPYDIKINDLNSARWTDNTFLGRTEPIYTYTDTTRTGQLSFKVVVDHPSVLNLLVREHFKNMTDEESDNYINAFFAGCEEIDFYSLIRKYAYLDSDDIRLVQSYLNKGHDTEIIKQYKTNLQDVVAEEPANNSPGTSLGSTMADSGGETITVTNINLKYDNDIPGPNLLTLTSEKKYSELYNVYKTKKTEHEANLTTSLTTLSTYSGKNNVQANREIEYIFGSSNAVIDSTSISGKVSTLSSGFVAAEDNYQTYINSLTTLKDELTNKNVQNITIKIESSASSVAADFYNLKLSLRRSYSVVKDVIDKIKGNSEDIQIKWIEALDPADDPVKVRVKSEYTFKELGYDYDGKLIFDTINYGEMYNQPDKSGWSTLKYPTTNPNIDCINKDFSVVNNLKITAPIAFGCRQTKFDLTYVKKAEEKPKPETKQVVKVGADGLVVIKPPSKKPPIDPMKRIIMKTLGECYYFKKLEEDSPLAFKSLKEKLKYFHPSFHSTTPEGLNSRLTFLLQCLRPGDTIPVKGISEETDLNARNTSFGPPPICVLRIGDFYHSKIIIRDVSITYDEGIWDLNPEGIGVQPMIANVSCQIAFIGGQGLSKPVERLQNALSSNFFANTEIYDERSISTNEKIGGMKAEEFTKQFLESLNVSTTVKPETDPNKNNTSTAEGNYLGITTKEGLSYTVLIEDVFKTTKQYFTTYVDVYNNIIPKYGFNIGTMTFSPAYREISQYDVYTTSSTRTISLFGLEKTPISLAILAEKLNASLVSFVQNSSDTYLCEMLGFNKDISGSLLIEVNNKTLKPFFINFIPTKLKELVDDPKLLSLDKARNDLIIALDKVNFLVKNSKDVRIDKEIVSTATLLGFTPELLYGEYESCINYIETNSSKLFSDFTSNIYFFNPAISAADFNTIMKEIMSTNDIKKLQDDLSKIKISDALINALKSKVNQFPYTISKKDFKFTKFIERKTSKEVIFPINAVAVETDTTIIDEGKKIFSNNNVVTDKLNFYRKR